MRILHIITGLSTGGSERALYNVLSGGLSDRHESVVISLRDEGTYGPLIRLLGVPVYCLHIQRGFPSIHAIYRLRVLVHELQPDWIQGWMYHGNLAATLAWGFGHKQSMVAWNIRQCLYELANEKILTRQVIRANRVLSGKADIILYNSHLSKVQHEVFGFTATHGRVIPNGFDTKSLRLLSHKRNDVRKQLGLPEDVLVVGHVARFHPMKDHANFLHAAVRVAQINPKAHFILVGHNVTRQNTTLSSILPLELEERFLFLGERPDVYEIMTAMNLLCSSSAWGEAFSNVLGEAMALGIPCISTDIGDSGHIVGETGLIVPPQNPDALAQGILELLSVSESYLIDLGQRARARIEANYALPKIVSQYAELYECMGSCSTHSGEGELNERG